MESTRKRSRANSNPFHHTDDNNGISSRRLLRLNVGGHPYDVVRTSIPLLETMMTDRWLDTCLYDSDGRIFLDRDGEVFGDVLRCLRNPDFLRQLMNNEGKERLRRLRSEADYYGLHDSLVRMIDDESVGQRVVLGGWARVAGGCYVEQEGAGEGRENNDDAAIEQAEENNNEEVNGVRDEAADEEDNEEVEEIDDEEVRMKIHVMFQSTSLVQLIICGILKSNLTNDYLSFTLHYKEQFELEEDQDDPNQPPPYKRWSWSKQFGNPDILQPYSSPTHSQMIVGEDGTYVILLRFAAALPSPLARIKWDQEEEEDRRVTRGARRRGRRGQNTYDPDETDGEDETKENKSLFVQEDYFVTVNIEAPLQTVMDYIDESQSHFPLLRAGLWDYRTEEEVLHEDPVFATVCAMDVVSLRAGDKLTVSYMNDEISRESFPLPDDAPPEL